MKKDLVLHSKYSKSLEIGYNNTDEEAILTMEPLFVRLTSENGKQIAIGMEYDQMLKIVSHMNSMITEYQTMLFKNLRKQTLEIITEELKHNWVTLIPTVDDLGFIMVFRNMDFKEDLKNIAEKTTLLELARAYKERHEFNGHTDNHEYKVIKQYLEF